MKVITQDNTDVDDIAQAVGEGKTLVYPTETCYGFGCDATNSDAVGRLFDIKQKQRSKPMLVIMASQEMAMEYVSWSQTLDKIAQVYWPGPLTVVAPVAHGITLPVGVMAADGTIAFRISVHPLVESIASKLDVPLVATSANITGQKSPYSIEEVRQQFEQQNLKPDIIIDGGSLPEKLPSTIVRVEGNHLSVVRQGEIIIPESI